jgi:putative hemolysin
MRILARCRFYLRFIAVALVTLIFVTRSAQIPVTFSLSGVPYNQAGLVSQAHRISNPAAVYCQDMGYTYQVVSDGAGGETDTCSMPDGQVCGAWDFLEGKCGQAWSYCARVGLRTRTAVDGKDPFSPDYSVCVDLQGRDVGSVTALDHLAVKVNRCGAKKSLPEASSISPGVVLPTQTAADLSLTIPTPSSWDWRYATFNGIAGDWTTPARNQGSCGSCWAFAAVGQTEAILNLAGDNPALDKNLSEEYLVSDCSSSGTCCGGWHSSALDFIEEHGIPDESCFPYVSGSCGCSGPGTCSCIYTGEHTCSNATCSQRCNDYDTRLSYIDTFGRVGDEHNSPDVQQARIKQALISYGPLSVAIDVAEGDNYWKGKVFMCSHPENVDHAVVIVGYDDAGGYWIVKNSWGSSYQDNGFFEVGYGQCFIERYVYYAHAVPTLGTVNNFLPLVIQQ